MCTITSVHYTKPTFSPCPRRRDASARRARRLTALDAEFGAAVAAPDLVARVAQVEVVEEYAILRSAEGVNSLAAPCYSLITAIA